MRLVFRTLRKARARAQVCHVIKWTNQITPSGERHETKTVGTTSPASQQRRNLNAAERKRKEMELLRLLLTVAVVSLLVVDVRAKLKDDECEGNFLQFYWTADTNRIMNFHLVCIKFLDNFVVRMDERDVSLNDLDKVEVELMEACADSQGKDSRFVSDFDCYCISRGRLYARCKILVSYTSPREEVVS